MKSLRANAYIGLMIAAGAGILAHGLWQWSTPDWTRYVFYLAIALVASGMKVTLPAVMGTMSMNFLFVLIGISELGRSETLAMGCLGMLVQCLVFTKTRPRPVQVLFSAASMACSTAAAWSVYHSSLLSSGSLEQPTRLMLASGTFFVTNTLSVALVIAWTERKRVWAVWRDSYFWTFPNYMVGAAVAWILSAASKSFGWQSSLLLLPVLYVVYRSHTLYTSRLEEEKKRSEQQRAHAEEVSALHRRTIEVLALAIEAKDQTTHDHLQRVEVYAIEVGKELGLTHDELEALRASALLHDIGKLAVPEYIIAKPGKLTPEEFEKMKIHPVVGAEIVEQVQFPYPVAPIVRAHHEKWDGSGYPDGLSGEQIPVGARILSAVDCLDALASDRQYRRALPLDEAIKVVRSEAGKSFDPRVVEVLARRYLELERMAKGSGQLEKLKLSTDLKVERGSSPAAGFEVSTNSADSSRDLMSFHHSIAESERQARLLKEAVEALDRCDERVAAFAALREKLPSLVPYAAMVIYSVHRENLIPEYVDGENYSLFASLEIPLGMGLSGWVAENARSIVNGNPSVEPGYLSDETKFSTLRSALAVPLEANGAVLGVLSLYRQEHDAFSAEHLGVLLGVGAKLATVLATTARALEKAGGSR
ncbi:MAG: diguanylate cyclase and metal dependent phosphohydrolase [Bryobacterales bacterium]|nr:diguanylate cyclase and metal dependent phosphohydrolase [Bryobacterales bacterium]